MIFCEKCKSYLDENSEETHFCGEKRVNVFEVEQSDEIAAKAQEIEQEAVKDIRQEVEDEAEKKGLFL